MLYITDYDASLDSAFVGEKILPGEVVAYDQTNDEVVLFDASTHSLVAGLMAGPRSASWTAADEDDFRAAYDDFAYYPSSHADADRFDGLHPAPYGGNDDGDKWRARTAKDNGTDPAPVFEPNDVVGLAAVGKPEFEGRLVQEGYTDGAATPVTYDRASGNFIPVGTVDVNTPEVREGGGSYSEFDGLVHVKRDKSL